MGYGDGASTIMTHRYNKGLLNTGVWCKLLLVVMLLSVAPAQAQSEPEGQAPIEQDREGWPEKVRFGILPIAGSEDATVRFQVLGRELEKILGIEVEIVSSSSYLGLIALMKKKELEFVSLGPYSYITAMDMVGAQAVAMELDQQGNPGYRAIIITRKDSGIETLEQGRGKVLAFTDPDSASGFLIPMMHFTRDLHLLPAEYFSKVAFAGDHLKLLEGVADSSYDLGTTNIMDFERSLEVAKLKEEDFRILWTSQMIPGIPYCVRSDLPESLKLAFRDGLMSVNDKPEALEVLGIGGFTEVSDTDYDIIRKLKAMQNAAK